MAGAAATLVVLIACGVWNRQNYLLELETQMALLRRDLQSVSLKNTDLEREIERMKNLAFEKQTRREIETAMSRMRELPFRKPVRYRRMAKGDLRAFILSKLRAQYTAEEFCNYELALKRIGLLPRQVNLQDAVADLLSEQVAALYDTDAHELCSFADPAGGGLRNNFQRMILAHELVHALQDQNFEFRALALRAKNNDDAAMAAAALVEGDASYQMGVYLRENYRAQEILGDLQLLFSQRTDKVLSAPAYLRDTLLFPYQEGQIFAAELHAGGGNAAIDAAFANPPQSTEQVLHPEKFLGAVRDAPKAVALTFKAGPLWKKLHENVLGELGIRSFFFDLLGVEEAARIAEGWGGDQFALYETATDKWVLVWKSVWDTEKDAREFFDALERFYRERYGAPDPGAAAISNPPQKKATPGADAVFFSVANQRQALMIRGKTVLFLDVPDIKMMQLLLSQLTRVM